MKKSITEITFEEEFRICPVCGYQDGFHSMLKQGKDYIQWLFICPSCHETFDIGHRLDQL